jgi:bifunctional UDP-N-acetylglucosamine pyrophosphorylase/glucosamine-1-phosphate N-acetyltransferase
MNDLHVLIIAAGKGTRMKSARAKVLHHLCGKPMVRYVFDAAAGLDPNGVYVVIGQDAGQVQDSLAGLRAEFIHQHDQLGTGHAVMVAGEVLSRLRGDVMVLFGDAPLIQTATLARLAQYHRQSRADMTLLTARTATPFGYGRILRDAGGIIDGIVEEKDATPAQRMITEINPSYYCFRIPPLLDALKSLTNLNVQKEYYLTDVLAIQRRAGRSVEAILHDDFEELRGINTRGELAELSSVLRRAKNNALMAAGVTLIDPQSAYIDMDVDVASEVTIHPMVTLEGRTRVGAGTVIHSGARIVDSEIGVGAQVLDCCLISDSHVGDFTTVGPFAHLRKATQIGANCRVGNFVEIKKSRLEDGVKAAHLAYLGDAEIGKDVNIGAGTITCNYDGIKKNPTVIEEGAFIGTDCQLVAPVRIGRGSYVAAGSCITEDVPADSLAIARSRQTVKQGWARRRKGSD